MTGLHGRYLLVGGLAAAALLLAALLGLQRAEEGVLSAAEASARAAAGELLIVDVRTSAEWRETGIPRGAARADIHDSDFLAQVGRIVRRRPLAADRRHLRPRQPLGPRPAGARRRRVRRGLRHQGRHDRRRTRPRLAGWRPTDRALPHLPIARRGPRSDARPFEAKRIAVCVRALGRAAARCRVGKGATASRGETMTSGSIRRRRAARHRGTAMAGGPA